jgi:hypothetical protein
VLRGRGRALRRLRRGGARRQQARREAPAGAAPARRRASRAQLRHLPGSVPAAAPLRCLPSISTLRFEDLGFVAHRLAGREFCAQRRRLRLFYIIILCMRIACEACVATISYQNLRMPSSYVHHSISVIPVSYADGLVTLGN